MNDILIKKKFENKVFDMNIIVLLTQKQKYYCAPLCTPLYTLSLNLAKDGKISN